LSQVISYHNHFRFSHLIKSTTPFFHRAIAKRCCKHIARQTLQDPNFSLPYVRVLSIYLKKTPLLTFDKGSLDMRKLKYYVACSVDGFIAHKDGSLNGFLAEGEHVTDYLDSFKSFDAVLMGRKTYEVGLKEGLTNPYPTMKSYVFSRTIKKSPHKNVEIVSEKIVKFVRTLKDKTGKDIYLCGGAELASMLIAENLVDEIILKMNPLLFGSGISLFSGIIKQTSLEFANSKIYSNGVLLLHYRVNH
jgi:dihydrofolate reductase